MTKVPHIIDPPTPYKEGSTSAQWSVEAKETTVWNRAQTILLVGVPAVVLVVALVVSLSTH